MKKDDPNYRIFIDWKDKNHDWNHFFLVGSMGEFLRLKGADNRDSGVRHRGDVLWVHYSEIESMVEL